MTDRSIDVVRLRYRLLGPVTVLDSNGVAHRFAPKPLAVLATLLLHPNQVVLYEELIASVWGQQPTRSAQGRLYDYVSELRVMLGKDSIDRVGGGYVIAVAPGELDLQVFNEAVAEAHAKLGGGEPTEAAAQLRSALALWNGPALGGVSIPLLEHDRPVLEERRLTALEALFEAELAAGNHIQVVDELGQVAARNPFRERLAALLILALHKGGRRTDALDAYTQIRHRLVDELGIEPGELLRETHEQIINGIGEETKPARPGQVDQPTGVAGPGPVIPAELPRQTAGFVGREDALTVLDTRLSPHDDNAWICVISGIAGVGKTALAVHWAHRVRDRFPDGQLYVDLRGYDLDHEPVPPITALGQLLRSLGVPSRRIGETVEERAALYRSLLINRRILLLLDNARTSGQVLPLLPPSGSVIVTSRQRLSDLVMHAGAHSIPVATMTDREGEALLIALLGDDRISTEPEAAAKLVHLCAGLPLALRIAAANLAAHPTTTLPSAVAELTGNNRLDALTLDGAEDSALASAFVASYRLLEPGQQRLFRLLGLVPLSNITAPVASAIAAMPLDEASRLLKGLVAACVIEQHGPSDYCFHDLIHLYAAAQADASPEHDEAWVRLIDYYLCAVTASTDHVALGTARLREKYPVTRECTHAGQHTPELVGLELSSMAAAATQAAERGPHPGAWLLVERLCAYYHRTSLRAEWLQVAPAILDAAHEHKELDVQALLHTSIGESCFRAGRSDDGVHHLNEAIRVAHECGWQECEAAAHAHLGVALTWIGDLDEAKTHTLEAAKLFAEIGSAVGEHRALGNLGGQYRLHGQMREAEKRYTEAFALSKRHELHFAHAIDLMLLGSLEVLLDRPIDAEQKLLRARESFERLNSLSGLAWTSVELSHLYMATEEYERARREGNRALELTRRTGEPLVEAAGLVTLSRAEIALHEYSSAGEHLQRAIGLARTNQARWHEAEGFTALAMLETRMGNHREAVDHAWYARTIARTNRYRPSEITALVALAEAHLDLGDLANGEAAANEALALARRCGVTRLERTARHLLAREKPA